MLIGTFVNAIYLYDDKILLTFNFKDSTETIIPENTRAHQRNSKYEFEYDLLCCRKREIIFGIRRIRKVLQ